jgi:hypothetical protein
MTKVKQLVQSNENVLTDYEEQANRLKLTKQIRELEEIRRLEEEEMIKNAQRKAIMADKAKMKKGKGKR